MSRLYGARPYFQTMFGAALPIAKLSSSYEVLRSMRAGLEVVDVIVLVQHTGGRTSAAGAKKRKGCAGIGREFGDTSGDMSADAEDFQHRRVLMDADAAIRQALLDLNRVGRVRIIGLLDRHGLVELVDLASGARPGQSAMLPWWRIRRVLRQAA